VSITWIAEFLPSQVNSAHFGADLSQLANYFADLVSSAILLKKLLGWKGNGGRVVFNELTVVHINYCNVEVTSTIMSGLGEISSVDLI
jgi:hypothetical protein